VSKENKIKNPFYYYDSTGELGVFIDKSGAFINKLQIIRSCSNVLEIVERSYNKMTYFYDSADNRQGYRICLRKIKQLK
jgi:hypothetical protein